jgi:hypothetical protein
MLPYNSAAPPTGTARFADGSSISARSHGSSLRKAWQPPAVAVHDADSAAHAAHADDSAEGRSLPVSRVLDVCLREPLVAQYRLVSRACVRLICDELRLRDTCAVLCGVAMAAQGRTLLDVALLVDEHAAAHSMLSAGVLNDVLPDGEASSFPGSSGGPTFR